MKLVQSTVLATWALMACSSDDGGRDGGKEVVATGCAADARKDVYVAGLSKPAGAMTVTLVEAKPAPPIKGTNVFTFQVVEGGQPVDGATLTVTPWMPDHAHGSVAKPIVTPAGSGVYTVDKIYLPMAGLWQITVGVQRAGVGPFEEATFQFCLD